MMGDSQQLFYGSVNTLKMGGTFIACRFVSTLSLVDLHDGADYPLFHWLNLTSIKLSTLPTGQGSSVKGAAIDL